MPRQTTLLAELFARERFTLIVLDACRYDSLMTLLDGDGNLPTGDGGALQCTPQKALSAGTHTYIWLQEALDGYYPDTQVYSGHPVINSAGETPESFIPTVNRNLFADDYTHPWRATEHFRPDNIHDAWQRSDVQDNYGTDPGAVVDEIREVGWGQRNIAWFMAPHAPYSAGGETPQQRYHNTLRDVVRLLAAIFPAPGRVVITGDHGEAFREPAAYGLEGIDWKDQLRHEPRVRIPALLNVPWLEVSQYIQDY